MTKNPIIPPTPSQEAYAVDADQGDVFTQDDPFALFEDWLTVAKSNEPNDPNAMALATVDAQGMPDVRMVLLKDIDVDGFTFYTSRLSAKGLQLAENPHAALCFHWKTIRRQIRVRGTVQEVPEKTAEAYFASRARGARIGAWASDQSTPIPDGAELSSYVTEYEQKFSSDEIPKPDYWTGYCLKPVQIEFWVNRPFRLHDRLVFKRDGDAWRTERLFP